MAKVISEKFSFEGWNFWEWLKGNLSTIKEIAKIGAPLIVGWVTTRDPALAALITVGGKFTLDCVEYFVKKYTK